MDQHLKVFITVVEKKNFSRAAETLLMTQPAVSQYVRVLEEDIGAKLLERSSKYVRVTKAGEIIYYHAKKIDSLYTRMQTLVDDLLYNASGTLTIGASFTFGEYVLPHLIATLQKQYPHIQPSIKIANTKDIVNDMAHHQLDIGIIEGKVSETKQMHIENFAEDEMFIIASSDHPLIQKNNSATIADLAKEKWILRESGSGTREAADTIFTTNQISPKNIIHFGSTQAVKEAVGAGLGISLLSKWAIQRELKDGYLQIIDVEHLPFIRQFSIVTTTPFQTKAQQVFIDLLRGKNF